MQQENIILEPPMEKIIEKLSCVFFILIAFLIVTSWEGVAQEQECVSGVEADYTENGTDCPSDYPILCSTSVMVPMYFCCPEDYSLCSWSEAPEVLKCCECASETIYKDNVEALILLRKLRDNILSQSQIGLELIKLYYQWSPVIVKSMEEDEEFKEDVREVVNGILGMVE